MGRIFAAMLAAGLLGACAAGGSSQGLPPDEAGPATPELTLATRHCYRTLARVDCHAQALTAEVARRVGFFDAAVGP